MNNTSVFLPEAAFEAALQNPRKAFLEGAAIHGLRSSPIQAGSALADLAWSSPLSPQWPLWVLFASDVSRSTIDLTGQALTGPALLLYLLRDGHLQRQVRAAQVNVAYVLLPAGALQSAKSDETQLAATLAEDLGGKLAAPSMKTWQTALPSLLNWQGSTRWQDLSMEDAVAGVQDDPNDPNARGKASPQSNGHDTTVSQGQPTRAPGRLLDSAARASSLMQQYQRLLLALGVAAG